MSISTNKSWRRCESLSLFWYIFCTQDLYFNKYLFRKANENSSIYIYIYIIICEWNLHNRVVFFLHPNPTFFKTKIVLNFICWSPYYFIFNILAPNDNESSTLLGKKRRIMLWTQENRTEFSGIFRLVKKTQCHYRFNSLIHSCIHSFIHSIFCLKMGP